MRLLARIPVGWLAGGVLVAAAYGVIAKPSSRGAFGQAGYLLEWWGKVGALLLAIVLACCYVVRVRRGAAPVFQLPVKLFLSTAVACLAAGAAWFAIAAAAQLDSFAFLYFAGVFVAGLVFTASFAGVWALLDRLFGVFSPRDVRRAYWISAAAQLAMVVFCVTWLSGAETWGMGSAVVILLIYAGLAPVVVGVLVLLGALGIMRLLVQRGRYFSAGPGVKVP